ncbi:SDR family NAD(P)-dependent oxidoreductase [Dyadobacter helix]|nr:SDR family oxidoreductase [Dyadobacter sp. CECT 9275]
MLKNKFNLKGKNALVTGSSQGIGKAIALALAEYGARIILHYRGDKTDAEKVARQIKKYGNGVNILQADFSRPKAVAGLYKKVSALVDHLDILVINASLQLPVDWLEISAKEIDLQVTTNFRATLQMMQRFAPAMIEKQWGRIVTIGSVQQERPHPLMAVYAATKSASLNLVQNIASQLAGKGVTVNNLAPGVIDTPRIKEELPPIDEKLLKKMDIPMDRTGMPEECATVALLLCSDAGSYITGQNIYVDGGMSL